MSTRGQIFHFNKSVIMLQNVSSPQVDKGDEFGREASLLGVAELRRVSPHHLGQLVEHTVPLRVGKPSCGQLVLKHTIYVELEEGKLIIKIDLIIYLQLTDWLIC